MMMGWEGLLALFYLVVGDGDDEIDEDGGGRGGRGEMAFRNRPVYYRSPSGVCDYEKTPMYDVVRENRYPSSGIQ